MQKNNNTTTDYRAETSLLAMHDMVTSCTVQRDLNCNSQNAQSKTNLHVLAGSLLNMEPPPTKKNRLENSAFQPEIVWLIQPTITETTTEATATEDAPAITYITGDVLTQPTQTSVRQQLHDLISEASAKSCGTPLPAEMTGKIIDYCLYSDFSELPGDVFEEGVYEVLGGTGAENFTDEDILKDPLRIDQLTAIKELPGGPIEPWGEEITELIENEDLLIWWVHVGFPVGWKGSGELMEFDLWGCFECHHYHAVFVFEKGSTDVLLRYEFCKAVKRPARAEELSDLSSNVLNIVTQY